LEREKIDLSQERTIIIMMIVSTDFLNRIAPVTKPKYFKSKYSRIISEWILEYWQEYRQAPDKNIQEIYRLKSKYLQEEEDTETIMEFLRKLSKEWLKWEYIHNIDFSIKQTIHYLKIRSLEILSEEIIGAVQIDDYSQGEQLVANYNRIEKYGMKGVRLLRDALPIADAFLNEAEIVFKFPGAIGELCGDFQRGDLVAFLASQKKGKSWWQWALSYMAMHTQMKVIFFSLEMTERQVLRRAWQSLVGLPRKDMEVTIPYFIDLENEKYKVKTRIENMKGVDISIIEKEQKKFRFYCRGGDVLIKVMPSNSMTVEMIEIELDNIMYYDDFIPDIVVIDYADILLPSIKGEHRHQLDHIWKKLRGLAQDRDILVVTASQANRKALKEDAGKEHIVEDIRRLGHVSKLIALNQSEIDKQNHGIRVKLLVERDGICSDKQVFVLYCYEIGRPCIDSRFLNKVIRENIKDENMT